MNIFLTGATGLVGGELLINLSKRKEIDKIYCLIRGKSEAEAILRIEKVFTIHNDYYDKNKVKVVLGDLGDETLTEKLVKEVPPVSGSVLTPNDTPFIFTENSTSWRSL